MRYRDGPRKCGEPRDRPRGPAVFPWMDEPSSSANPWITRVDLALTLYRNTATRGNAGALPDAQRASADVILAPPVMGDAQASIRLSRAVIPGLAFVSWFIRFDFMLSGLPEEGASGERKQTYRTPVA